MSLNEQTFPLYIFPARLYFFPGGEISPFFLFDFFNFNIKFLISFDLIYKTWQGIKHSLAFISGTERRGEGLQFRARKDAATFLGEL